MANLELIHQGDDSGRKLHVIYVHGLGGHIRDTWMHDPADAASLWPTWVGEDLECPVWLLGYDATLSGWRDGAMPLTQQGAAVLDLMAAEPRLRDARFVLIGHSMGGLVVKTALVESMTLGVQRYSFFSRQLRGVVFMATPHFGSHLANLAVGLRLLLRTNDQVGDLHSYDPQLATLNTQFRAQHKKLGFAVRSFCETRGVTFRRRLFGLLRAPSIRVVDGADPHVDGDSGIYLPEGHFSICKPQSRDAQIYKSLVGFLKYVERRDASPFFVDASRYVDTASIDDTGDSLTARVNGCEIRVVAGRLEHQAIGNGVSVVLPCNEYFDDKCADDTRNALGAYVAARLEGRATEFVALVKEQCQIRFGEGQRRKKTEFEIGESYGVGKCLLLASPLGSATPIALLSTTTQRASDGLTARISDLFSGIEDLAGQMADARIQEAVMPVLGAGHGGLTPVAALCGLLMAIVQVARKPSARLRRVTVVVFRRDDHSRAQIDGHQVRQALALVAA